ncbi:MAG: ricin-type beta-trefoil lectin domain protein [Pseudomonadota bacterium]
MTRFTTLAIAATLWAGVAQAENVEVYVVDMLDNIQAGYCLDIAKGQGASANPEDGLQAHTCYSPSGEVFVDQAFASDQFADGVLYMPEFDVCMQAASAEAGGTLELVTCDASSEAQSWVFDGEGTISPAAAPELCVTLAEETRTGRSEENQMKALSLETCSEDMASSQVWSNRSAN